MAMLYNLARMTTATTGTGTITLGSAVSGFLTFAQAGVSNGVTVAYSIRDGANSEMGYGTYTSSGTTLTRNVTTSTNSNTTISLSGSAQVAITGRSVDIDNYWVNVESWGAVGDGSTDDTTAIQNAINSLPVSGGDVYFPQGTYKITSTLTIGNGSTTAGSTRWGVNLRGAGHIRAEYFGPNSPVNTSTVTLQWGGSAGGTILQIAGPLMGWGIHNICLDGMNGATTAAKCLQVVSGTIGHVTNLHVLGGTSRCVELTAVASFSGDAGNDIPACTSNLFENLYIRATDQTTNTIALALDGTTASDSYFNTFINTFIVLPSGAPVATVGILLACTDSNSFYDLTVQGVSAHTGIKFDYTNAQGDAFPNTNRFMNIDLQQCGTQITNVGTPNASIEPNAFINVSRNNGGTYPTVANTINFSAAQVKLQGVNPQPTQSGGVIGYDGADFLACPADNAQALIPTQFYGRLCTAYTLTSTTSQQKLFNWTSNGALTLPATGIYEWECMFAIDTMSGTSGNAGFSILGGGTATLGNSTTLQGFIGTDDANADTNPPAMSGQWNNAIGLSADVVTPTGNTFMWALWKGTFDCSVVGTIIPSISLKTASAAVVRIGSYFKVHRLGITGAGNIVIGPWS